MQARARYGRRGMERSGSGHIVVISIGPVEADILTEITGALARVFRCEAVTGGGMAVPEDAFNARRGQYLSSAILTELLARKPVDCFRPLGVIDRDLYVPQLNFVFGEADPRGGAAVISLARLREEYYGNRADTGVFRSRAIKEAVHEIGHTLGLGHCPAPRCVMSFSNSLDDTDRKGADLCDRCREHLASRRSRHSLTGGET